MSHFALAVIHRERGMAEFVIEPYCTENNEYFEREIYMAKEDYIQGYKLLHPESTLNDEEIWANRSLEYDDYDDEYIYTNCNPSGRYDYCRVGGRFGGALKVRKNTEHYMSRVDTEYKNQPKNRYLKVDSAKINDILFNKMNYNKTKSKMLTETWHGLTDLQKSRYTNRNEFLRANIAFYTHAIYNEDTGEWMEVDDFNKIEEYIDYFYSVILSNSDCWLTIMDCHI